MWTGTGVKCVPLFLSLFYCFGSYFLTLLFLLFLSPLTLGPPDRGLGFWNNGVTLLCLQWLLGLRPEETSREESGVPIFEEGGWKVLRDVDVYGGVRNKRVKVPLPRMSVKDRRQSSRASQVLYDVREFGSLPRPQGPPGVCE